MRVKASSGAALRDICLPMTPVLGSDVSETGGGFAYGWAKVEVMRRETV